MTRPCGGGSGLNLGKLAAQPRVSAGSWWHVAHATGLRGSGDAVHHRSPSATIASGPASVGPALGKSTQATARAMEKIAVRARERHAAGWRSVTAPLVRNPYGCRNRKGASPKSPV